MLSFQRLEVYQCAIQFLALAYDIVADLPKGNSERADQLIRSAESSVDRSKPASCGRVKSGQLLQDAFS